MSTRSNIIVKDNHNSIQLYRHSDGYPNSEHGVIANLAEVLPFAWDLPRMEADDFAAAIVAAWKRRGGNIYIDGTARDDTLHGDIEYYYVITPDEKTGKWRVEVHDYCSGYGNDIPKKDKIIWTGYIGEKYPE